MQADILAVDVPFERLDGREMTAGQLRAAIGLPARSLGIMIPVSGRA